MVKVIQYQTGMANGFFVLDKEIIAVDCGSEFGKEPFLTVCREHQIDPASIKLLIVTHGHVDHFVNIGIMKELTGAPILCHKNAASYLQEGLFPDVQGRNEIGCKILEEQEISGPPVDFVPRVKPDIIFEGSMDLSPWGISGRIIETPGHSPCSTAIILDSGEAIVGDTILETPGMGQVGLAYFSGPGCSDGQLFDSVQTIINCAQVIYSGHGGPFSREQVVEALAKERGSKTMATIEERLAKLEHEIQRQAAVTEILNCIGRYEGVHKPMTMYLTPETFALTMPDVSMEVSDWGVFVGAEAIKFQFGEMMKEEIIGCMFDHYIATPIIEVAGDGKTARAKFDSPGHETQIDGKGGRKAYWAWGSYSAEFIKEADGRWRIWHLKWWRTFRTDFYKSWVDDWQNVMTGPAHEHDWEVQPCTFFHPYDPLTERWPFPLPPEPYETYEGTMLDWAFGGEKYKGLKEAYFAKYGTPTGAFEFAHGRKAGINLNNPAGASFKVTRDQK